MGCQIPLTVSIITIYVRVQGPLAKVLAVRFMRRMMQMYLQCVFYYSNALYNPA